MADVIQAIIPGVPNLNPSPAQYSQSDEAQFRSQLEKVLHSFRAATTSIVTLSGNITTDHGGTGLLTYTAGDMTYWASGTAFTKLAIGSANKVLTSTGTAPQWSTTIAYSALPTGGGTWANGGTLSITGGVTTVAGLTSSALITANAGLTVASGQTLTVTGATITGLTAPSVGAGTFPAGTWAFAATSTVVIGTDPGTFASEILRVGGNVVFNGTIRGLQVSDTLTPSFVGVRGRAGPAAVQLNDPLVTLQGQGYDSSAYVGGGTFQILAQTTWTGATRQSRALLSLVPAASTATTNYYYWDATAFYPASHNALDGGLTGTRFKTFYGMTGDFASAAIVGTDPGAATTPFGEILRVGGSILGGDTINSLTISNSTSPVVHVMRARAASTALQNADTIGSFGAIGHDGTSFITDESGYVGFVAVGAFTASSHPTRMVLATTPVGSTAAVPAWQVESTGDFITPISTADIGQSAGSRPRTVYAGTSMVSPIFAGAVVQSNAATNLLLKYNTTTKAQVDTNGFLVGTDPGSTEPLRVGGGAIALALYRASSSGGSAVGFWKGYGQTADATIVAYGQTGFLIGANTNAAQDGTYHIDVASAGALTTIVNVTKTGAAITGVLSASTRLTAPLIGTTTAADVVLDRNSVTQLTLGSLLATFAGAVTVSAGAVLVTNGDVKLQTAGNGIYVKEGTNATMGTAVLVGGTVTVNTTKVTANSRIFLTEEAAGGTLGSVYISARTAGTSFAISSTNALDTSTVAWLIVEPA